jgi:hypothetical protein
LAKSEICPRCGASTTMTICEHCGSLAGEAPDRSSERAALDQLHGLVSSKPPEGRADVLAHGFLPTDPEILIDAGLRCIPLLGSAEVGEAAAQRLEVVIAKLRIHEPTPTMGRAVETLEGKLEKHRVGEKRFQRAGCLAFVLLGILAVWGGVQIVVWLGARFGS